MSGFDMTQAPIGNSSINAGGFLDVFDDDPG
jgi:hypothetical protein